MRIQLTMRVIYLGPMRETTSDYTAEEATARHGSAGHASTAADLRRSPSPTWMGDGDGRRRARRSSTYQLGFIHCCQRCVQRRRGRRHRAAQLRRPAVDRPTTRSTTQDRRMATVGVADCSSFVWGGFDGVGQAAADWRWWRPHRLRQSRRPMCEGFTQSSTAVQKIWGLDGDTDKDGRCQEMQTGDILLRVGSGDLETTTSPSSPRTTRTSYRGVPRHESHQRRGLQHLQLSGHASTTTTAFGQWFCGGQTPPSTSPTTHRGQQMIPPGSRYEDAEHYFTKCHTYNEWGFPVLEGEKGMDPSRSRPTPGTRCT